MERRGAGPNLFMDEVDGRPGHVALQSGHLDAPQDARNASLRMAQSSIRPRQNFEIKGRKLAFSRRNP